MESANSASPASAQGLRMTRKVMQWHLNSKAGGSDSAGDKGKIHMYTLLVDFLFVCHRLKPRHYLFSLTIEGMYKAKELLSVFLFVELEIS